MDWGNPKSVETRIKRLTREIGQLDTSLYGSVAREDRIDLTTSLERKRDDLVRGAVLNIHTAIEDLLTQLLLYCLLGITDPALKHRLKSSKAKALRKLLYGAGSLGFDMKLNLALGMGLLTVPQQAPLMELNTMRNKCSHNWQLKAVVRRGKRPSQKKPPLLLFRGNNLHRVAVLDGFMSEFSMVYLLLYSRWVS
jgi:hypothetical protein